MAHGIFLVTLTSNIGVLHTTALFSNCWLLCKAHEFPAIDFDVKDFSTDFKMTFIVSSSFSYLFGVFLFIMRVQINR